MSYLFTSESVSEGHPDKVADQISDAILDAYLREDPASHVAVETLVAANLVVLAGEHRSAADVDHEAVVRQVLRDIGYTDDDQNFAADTVKVCNHIGEQSSDIENAVVKEKASDQGAGDQGMMFGYASRESDQDQYFAGTAALMPLPLMYAHRLVHRLARIRKQGAVMQYLRPDAKSQVTIEFCEDAVTPCRVHTVVISTQHLAGVSQAQIDADIRRYVLPEVLDPALFDEVDTEVLVNPSGRFVSGGPEADAGLTGRKIIVDTYGGRGAHGGGAFSGKDPSKVDRSAAYMARYIAKNVVAAGLADQVELQLSYAIGKPDPLSVYVNTSNTARHGLCDSDLRCMIKEEFDLTPKGIERRLNLRRPIYQRTAAYGHFGRDCFPWEQLDAVAVLKQRLDYLFAVP